MKRQKIARRGIILLFIVAVVALYVAIYVVPDIAGALKKTTILEYGTLSISDDVTAYIVRDEAVYMADHAGDIQYYVGEGVKVRKGTKVLDIMDGAAANAPEVSQFDELIQRIGENGQIPGDNEGGVVSYFIDGYEKVFTPESMHELTAEKVGDLKGEVVNLTREHTYAGEPIYKITDNNQWYLLFWLERDSASVVKYEAGKSVKAVFENGEVKGRVQDVLEQKKDWLVIVKFDRYYENLAQVRSAPVTIVASDYSGLLVENENLINIDGQIGVYVKRKSGSFEFVPVQVKTSDGAHSIIAVSTFIDAEGKEVKTVNVYEEIERKPTKRDS